MAEVSQASGNRSAAIRHFTELIVWQKAFAVGPEVFRLSRSWPAEEKSALTDQVRRSSRSIGANIAEAWGKRRDEAAFAAKPTDADAEAHATEHGLINAIHTAPARPNSFVRLALCWSKSVRCPVA